MAAECAVGRPVHQRIDREQVDEGGRRIDAVRAARAHGRTEGLGEPHQTKIANVDFLAGDGQTLALDHAARTDVLGRVDQDVDAGAVLAARCSSTETRVGDVERHDLDALDPPQRILAGKRLPRIGEADEHDGCAASDKALAIAWPTALRPSVISTRRNFGSQVSSRHCGSSACWRVSCAGRRDHDGLAAFVELQREPHTLALARVAMEMRHDGPARSRAPRCRPATACARGNRRRSRSGSVVSASSVPPLSTSWNGQPGDRQTRAGIARRIDDRAAIGADLQREAALGGGRGQAERGAAANALRQQRRPASC